MAATEHVSIFLTTKFQKWKKKPSNKTRKKQYLQEFIKKVDQRSNRTVENFNFELFGFLAQNLKNTVIEKRAMLCVSDYALEIIEKKYTQVQGLLEFFLQLNANQILIQIFYFFIQEKQTRPQFIFFRLSKLLGPMLLNQRGEKILKHLGLKSILIKMVTEFAFSRVGEPQNKRMSYLTLLLQMKSNFEPVLLEKMEKVINELILKFKDDPTEKINIQILIFRFNEKCENLNMPFKIKFSLKEEADLFHTCMNGIPKIWNSFKEFDENFTTRNNGTEHVIKVKCQFCEKLESNEKSFKKCSACRLVYYCSRKCQKLDWKKHKKNCKISN